MRGRHRVVRGLHGAPDAHPAFDGGSMAGDGEAGGLSLVALGALPPNHCETAERILADRGLRGRLRAAPARRPSSPASLAICGGRPPGRRPHVTWVLGVSALPMRPRRPDIR